MISRRDVQHIARLARIELSAAEEEKLEQELSSILEFVEKLNEVDTTHTLPMTGATLLEQVVRGDRPLAGNQASVEELIRAAPAREKGWVKVKAVFE